MFLMCLYILYVDWCIAFDIDYECRNTIIDCYSFFLIKVLYHCVPWIIIIIVIETPLQYLHQIEVIKLIYIIFQKLTEINEPVYSIAPFHPLDAAHTKPKQKQLHPHRSQFRESAPVLFSVKYCMQTVPRAKEMDDPAGYCGCKLR